MKKLGQLCVGLFLTVAAVTQVRAQVSNEPAPFVFQSLTQEEFESLSLTERSQYNHELIEAFVAFEDSGRAIYELAGRDRQSPLSSLIDAADAADRAADGATCLIGGSIQPVVNKKCSTHGRECNGPDTFRCGELYNNACISRLPVGKISRTCAETLLGHEPDDAQYAIVTKAQSAFNANCDPNKGFYNRVGCENFSKDSAHITESHSQRAKLALEAKQARRAKCDAEMKSMKIPDKATGSMGDIMAAAKKNGENKDRSLSSCVDAKSGVYPQVFRMDFDCNPKGDCRVPLVFLPTQAQMARDGVTTINYLDGEGALHEMTLHHPSTGPRRGSRYLVTIDKKTYEEKTTSATGGCNLTVETQIPKTWKKPEVCYTVEKAWGHGSLAAPVSAAPGTSGAVKH